MRHRARREIDAGKPSLAQRLGGRLQHPRKRFDLVELAKCGRREGLANSGHQSFSIDGARKSTGQSGRQLLERQHLKAVRPVAGSLQEDRIDREPALSNDGPTRRHQAFPSAKQFTKHSLWPMAECTYITAMTNPVTP
jgi:hypothetical protein